MKIEEFQKILKFINDAKYNEAELLLSNMREKKLHDADYMYLRALVAYKKDLIYLAADILFIGLQKYKDERFFKILSDIYKELGNEQLSDQLANVATRDKALNNLLKYS